MGTLPDENVGLVLERAGVFRIGPVDLREEQRNLLDSRVGIGPPQEAVVRPCLPVMVSRMELLEVLPAFCLGASERDLDQLAHLRRPASKGLDELSEGQRSGGLWDEFVFVDVLHGARILAAVRRPSPGLPLARVSCDD